MSRPQLISETLTALAYGASVAVAQGNMPKSVNVRKVSYFISIWYTEFFRV